MNRAGFLRRALGVAALPLALRVPPCEAAPETAPITTDQAATLYQRGVIAPYWLTCTTTNSDNLFVSWASVAA